MTCKFTQKVQVIRVSTKLYRNLGLTGDLNRTWNQGWVGQKNHTDVPIVWNIRTTPVRTPSTPKWHDNVQILYLHKKSKKRNTEKDDWD